jgi:cation diffusion facilitator family transporter
VVHSLFAPHSHDAADSVDAALESSAEGIWAVKVSLVVLMLTATAQLLVVILTGSVALLADTIHNFSDGLTAVPLWIAFVVGRRAATRRYTYGYGRAEDLSGLFIVAMILLSAVLAGYESIRRLLDPQPISNPWVVMAAGVVGFIGNEWVAGYRIRVGRRIGSAALIADGLHARTDGFTSLAVAAGAIGVMLGFPVADPIVGILITIAIVAVLRRALVEVFRRLMDGVDPALVANADKALRSIPDVIDVRRLRMRWDGHHLTVDADIAVDPALTLVQARDVSQRAESRLIEAVPSLAVADVHPQPAVP